MGIETGFPEDIVDLFAGCGGMSLGFELAGYRCVLANEADEWASETYAANHPKTKVVTSDIRSLTSVTDLLRKHRIRARNIAGIIGGPPCQGFSMSGTRDPKDPRNSLFVEFLRFVSEINPPFFVIENVPGIRTLKLKSGRSAEAIIVDMANQAGFNVAVLQLNAWRFGVPQSRERVFIVGLRNDIPFVAERLIPEGIGSQDMAVTAWDAISDLPQIASGEVGSGMPYASRPKNAFQSWARERTPGVRNHDAMRHTQRLIERFSVIACGQSVEHVPVEHSQRKRGAPLERSGKAFGQNNMRVYPDRPAPTVPASFQSNFIHPYLNRNFTAREGARLQSFPDWYEFKGRRTTMSWERNLSQYQQIGNAVPPLLARAVAEAVRRYLQHPPAVDEMRLQRFQDATLFDPA